MELHRTWAVASVLFLAAALSLLLVALARPVRFAPAELRLGATSVPAATPAAPAAPLATAPALPFIPAPASAAPAATVVPSSNGTAAPAIPSAPPGAAPSDPGSMNTLDPIGVGDPPAGWPKSSLPPKGSSRNGP